MKINSTVIFAIMLLVANSIYFIEGIRTAPPIRNGEVSITFFPIFISLLMYFAATFILIEGLKKEKIFKFNLRHISKPIGIIIVTALFIIIFKKVGYIISSFFYVFSIMWLLQEQKKGNRFLDVMFSIIIILIIYLLYQKIFGIRLPMGEVFL